MFSNKLRYSGNARNIFQTTIRAHPFLHIQENNACHSHSPQALFPPRRMRRVTHSLIKKKSGSPPLFHYTHLPPHMHKQRGGMSSRNTPIQPSSLPL